MMTPDPQLTAPDGGAPRVPTSTYRLQFNGDFDFAAGAAVAPYLAALGVSHAYCSPYLQAEAGSRHGYDVSDHTQVNSELGGSEGHAAFCHALREAGLGQVLDIVPNHMSIASPDNAWWWDVLKRGAESDFAGHFDIDWASPSDAPGRRILVPILGDHYGRILDAGEIHVEFREGEPVIAYYDHRLPLDPATVPAGLGPAEIETLNEDRDALHDLLEHQHYRLASWRTASQELAHRRFFDVNTLAGLRIESERVFLDTHALVLRWLDSGVLDGVRVDHPDGLSDPAGYLRRLHEAAPWAWVVIEKILARGEELDGSLPIAGSTGYESLNRVLGLFIDPEGESPLTELLERLTGLAVPFSDVAHSARLQVATELLGSDLDRLARLLNEVCEANRRLRDHTPGDQRAALAEVIACLPVYRTYAEPGRIQRPEDVGALTQALEAARGRRPDLDPELYELIATLVLTGRPGEAGREFSARFQQTTGAVMAKGVEDTAFYRYHRLTCLNEVGGDPGHWQTSPGEFHAACLSVAEKWPATLNASTTHDTKRSEDVRARLALLSEMPARWAAVAEGWFAANTRHRVGPWPDPAAEYLLYQTLVGAHPLSEERCRCYLEKALREAKTLTSWIRPDPAYEQAVMDFVGGLYADAGFQAELEAFVRPLVEPARINSLSSKLITLTAPGIPDIYQGTELWDLSLVDPDNRRPVDYDLRRRLLSELDGLSPEAVWARADEGLPKLLAVARSLALRRRRPEHFGAGADYRPLAVSGERALHLLAFVREGAVVTLAPRLVLGLGGDWRDSVVELPPGPWHNEFTGDREEGGVRRVADLLRRFPVGLLSRPWTAG